ncbi:MAG: hypothetical protein LBK56_01060 [Gracilibacteraceae bacterium]|jgi:hypothetical protein|nr:hypothetical protein [Gracilibacteraceae bacterium]
MKKLLLITILCVCAFLVLGTNSFADNEADSPETSVDVDEYQYTDAIAATVGFSGSYVNASLAVYPQGNQGVTKIIVTMSIYSVSPSGTRTRVGYWPNEQQTSFPFSAYKSVGNAQSGYQYEFSGSAKVYAGSQYETVDFSTIKMKS